MAMAFRRRRVFVVRTRGGEVAWPCARGGMTTAWPCGSGPVWFVRACQSVTSQQRSRLPRAWRGWARAETRCVRV
jgi:hypothetical protein